MGNRLAFSGKSPVARKLEEVWQHGGVQDLTDLTDGC